MIIIFKVGVDLKCVFRILKLIQSQTIIVSKFSANKFTLTKFYATTQNYKKKHHSLISPHNHQPNNFFSFSGYFECVGQFDLPAECAEHRRLFQLRCVVQKSWRWSESYFQACINFSFYFQIKNTFNTLSRRPKPIANDLKLSKNEWDELDKAASLLTSDYKRRAELIIRRLDVTVDSFFWSERIQQLEQKVNNVYNSKREQIAEWQPLGASDVLAATEGNDF